MSDVVLGGVSKVGDEGVRAVTDVDPEDPLATST